jgi:hypothetical protein
MVTIQLAGPAISPRLLGAVAPGAVETFISPDDLAFPGEYRLLAQLPDGRTVRSSTFFLSDVGVSWSLAANSVRRGGAPAGLADQ